MNSDQPLRVLLLSSLLMAESAAAAQPLRHDIFARPTLTALTVTAQEIPAGTPTEMWTPKLTAVMVAGSNSLATIDGRILKVGEFADGFRLVAVRENTAVLTKDGQRHVLTMSAHAPVSIKARSEP